MFFSESPQSLEINTCPRTSIHNTYELMNVPGDVLNNVGNVEDKDDYGFTGLFSKKPPLLYMTIPKCN